jgi:hypothetical protein
MAPSQQQHHQKLRRGRQDIDNGIFMHFSLLNWLCRASPQGHFKQTKASLNSVSAFKWRLKRKHHSGGEKNREWRGEQVWNPAHGSGRIVQVLSTPIPNAKF